MKNVKKKKKKKKIKIIFKPADVVILKTTIFFTLYTLSLNFCQHLSSFRIILFME